MTSVECSYNISTGNIQCKSTFNAVAPDPKGMQFGAHPPEGQISAQNTLDEETLLKITIPWMKPSDIERLNLPELDNGKPFESNHDNYFPCLPQESIDEKKPTIRGGGYMDKSLRYIEDNRINAMSCSAEGMKKLGLEGLGKIETIGDYKKMLNALFTEENYDERMKSPSLIQRSIVELQYISIRNLLEKLENVDDKASILEGLTSLGKKDEMTIKNNPHINPGRTSVEDFARQPEHNERTTGFTIRF